MHETEHRMCETSEHASGLKTASPTPARDKSSSASRHGRDENHRSRGRKQPHNVNGHRTQQTLLAFCSPANSLTLGGSIENPLVGEK